jgi:DNA polymerase I
MFQIGRDPHNATKKRLESKGIRITRSQAKAINFAICYGGTAWSIQNALGCSLSTAHRIMRELSSIYPGVAGYLDRVAQTLNEEALDENGCR